MNCRQKVRDIIIENIIKSNKNEKECLKACGINTSFLTDWKNDKIKFPSYDKVVKLAEYLNIDLSYLFLGRQIPKKQVFEYSQKQQELFDIYEQLTPWDQGRVFQFISDIADTRSAAPENNVSSPDSDPAVPTAACLDEKKHLA